MSASQDVSCSQVVEGLKSRGKKIAIVESCTGGLIASMLTGVPGSSAVFAWGMVLYDHQSKSEILGLNPQTFINHGSVSQPAVDALSTGALRKSGADLALAVSGIAGPGGGSQEKPVGTCWISLSSARTRRTIKYVFPGDRLAYRYKALQASLNLIIQTLEN